VILELKINQNAFVALEELTAPPDPIVGFQGADRSRGGEVRKGEGI